MKQGLDIGCGSSKTDGFVGVDHYPFPGVDVVHDISRGLPFMDNRFVSIVAKHILEHFDGMELIGIIEELWRVSVLDAEWLVVLPGKGSPNCGKDFTHKKKDWDQFSFDMWKKENGKYIIERGPLYGIQGQLVLQSFVINDNMDAFYRLRVVK